jgi:hypothetical protein
VRIKTADSIAGLNWNERINFTHIFVFRKFYTNAKRSNIGVGNVSALGTLRCGAITRGWMMLELRGGILVSKNRAKNLLSDGIWMLVEYMSALKAGISDSREFSPCLFHYLAALFFSNIKTQSLSLLISPIYRWNSVHSRESRFPLLAPTYTHWAKLWFFYGN